MSHPVTAYVRRPAESFVAALGQQADAPAINSTQAQAQHRLYVRALREAGLEVIELPSAPDLPDSCFVQDVALFLPEMVIFGRPAEPTRQAEVALLRQQINTNLAVAAIEAPGTLEWGDVLRLRNVLYVGQSSRSNESGRAQLRRLVEPLGLSVEALPVPAGLHLLSGVNSLGPPPGQPQRSDVILAWEDYAGLPPFVEAALDVIVVPAEEAQAANCLALGSTVIAPAGFPQTAAAIWHRGFRVLCVPVGEFAKADGGVTCLSLLA